jgi:pimeloyl-ACP methyl ester carboxylesterase
LSGKVAEQLKNGRVIDVADTGHFVTMQKPEFVAEQAIEFLTVT